MTFSTKSFVHHSFTKSSYNWWKNMKNILKPFALCAAFMVVSLTSAAQSDQNADWTCDPGWTAFKDEKCFKIFDSTTRTYADAVSSCASLADGATLPSIHSRDDQAFLTNYLFNTSRMVDNFWIGAQFVDRAFGWVDKSIFSYTNWDSRGPRSRANYCVQMQFDGGKWYDDPCERKFAVVCQILQTWSMARMQQTFLDARKELRDALDEQKQAMANLIPIGFLYTQLPNEKPPTAIWPTMRWRDVSSVYSGVFFRVEGGGSALFGQTQKENDRKVVQMEISIDGGSSTNNTMTVNGNSDRQFTTKSGWLYIGDDAWHGYTNKDLHLRLETTTGEIRPRNMAIRIWKRTR